MQSSSRNGARVIWLALHTTEGIMRAKDLRDWKSWAGSSHAANDETGVLMTPRDGFVPYDRAAWTLRNGNPISENLEQCGWARWTRAEWLARPKLLETTALWLADRARARGIPLVKLSDADIRARRPGVIGHGDYSRATGDGTHWDPGPGYPWDVVLDKARWLLNPTPIAPAAPPPPPEEDVTPEQDQRIKNIEAALTGKVLSKVPGSTYKGTVTDYVTNNNARLYDLQRVVVPGLQATVQELAKTLAAVAGGAELDVDELVERIGRRTEEAMAKVVRVEVDVTAPAEPAN